MFVRSTLSTLEVGGLIVAPGYAVHEVPFDTDRVRCQDRESSLKRLWIDAGVPGIRIYLTGPLAEPVTERV